MADAKFRIGNLERLLTLPVPSEKLEATPARAGAVLTALNGRRTVQTFGYARSWTFVINGVTEDEVAEIESLYQNNIQPPFYMFDPSRRNLLPREIAAPSSTMPGIGLTAFGATGNMQTQWTDPVNHPVPQATTSVYVNNGSGGNYIRRSDPSHLGEPIVPEESYTFTAWIKHVNTISATAYIQYRDRDGTDIGGSTGEAALTPEVGWRRATLTTTAPAGAVYVETGIYCDASAEFNVGPSQLEIGSVATNWVPGYGTPAVAIESFDVGYPRFGLFDVELTIVET